MKLTAGTGAVSPGAKRRDGRWMLAEQLAGLANLPASRRAGERLESVIEEPSRWSR